MKKLILAALAAAALALPATAARASADMSIVRVTSCPTQYTGTVVQVWQQGTGWVDLVWLCVPPIAP